MCCPWQSIVDRGAASVALEQLRNARKHAQAYTLELERYGAVPMMSYLAWYLVVWGTQPVDSDVVAEAKRHLRGDHRRILDYAFQRMLLEA